MNKYNKVRQIGEGAFGKAILVKRKDTSKQFVIKEINIIKMKPKEREESKKEVAVLAQLKHPNIVSYIESFEEKGSLYIVMNFCSGGDLYQKITERRGRPFTEDQVLDWFVQLCLAVKHLHDRKILHRDIKSQNIFLTHNGTVQLGDFGIAKVLNSTMQLAHTTIGTPFYLSPEVVEHIPYNNKSDIWSMGCVLYELTTLKHAFEAASMKELVMKIIRASYSPISPQFSYDLRGLIAQLFKRHPRDRPTVNAILRKNFIMQRVRRLLSADDLADEFSHTVMHGHKIAKALPPAPKPSADPAKKPTPRPDSANKRYDPSAVYGAPLSNSKNRMSAEKKRPSTPGGRPLPVPGQVEWEKKMKDRKDAEQRRRIEMRKREQEMNERRHRDLIEKQRIDRINKAREEGWKHLKDPQGVEQNRAQAGRDRPKSPNPRPLPVPRNNGDQDRGNYESYNAFLAQLRQQDRETPPPDPRGPNPNHVDVINFAAPRPVPAPQGGNQQRDYNMGPLGVAFPAAIDQAGRDRQQGAQAAQRARVVEDYIQRQRQAALNKMRAQNDLYGRVPSAGRRTPVPAPNRGPSPKPGGRGSGNGGGRRGGGGGGGGGGGMIARNQEEQEYLEKLRQIRQQNMRDRRAIRGVNVAENADQEAKNAQEAEERKRKVDALRVQAEQWADAKKGELERQKLELIKQGKVPPPGPGVPITNALQAIQGDGQQGPQLTMALEAVKGTEATEQERPKTAEQMKKENILKKLNNKNVPGRKGWGQPASPVVPPAAEEGRGKWGPLQQATELIAQETEADDQQEEQAETSRSHWGEGGKQLRLSKVPLELTASHMEATSADDAVIKMAIDSAATKLNSEAASAGDETQRKQWGRGSKVITALDKLPICQDTVTLDDSSQESTPTTPTPPVGIGSTITVSQKAPIASGTITVSSASKPATTKPTSRPLPLPPERSGTIVLSSKDRPAGSGKDENPTKTPELKKSSTEKVKSKFEEQRDGAKSVQMNLTVGNFDMKNVELLRTCSEPDLAKLSRTLMNSDGAVTPQKGQQPSETVTPSTIRRAKSLDLNSTNAEENMDDEGDDGEDFAEEDLEIFDDDDEGDENEDDNDENNEDDDGDDDDDMKSMMATMQSLLDESDDETKVDNEDKKQSVKFKVPANGGKMTRQKSKSRRPDNTADGTGGRGDTESEESGIAASFSEDSPKGGDEDAGDNGDDEDNDDDGIYDEEDEENAIQEKIELEAALALGNESDSDEESTFGDGTSTDDYDHFGRLEQWRAELERELGVKKLVEIYQTVQNLLEEEGSCMEKGAKIAVEMLTEEKKHLFPKIFQLVMSDTAFTEDN